MAGPLRVPPPGRAIFFQHSKISTAIKLEGGGGLGLFSGFPQSNENGMDELFKVYEKIYSFISFFYV